MRRLASIVTILFIVIGVGSFNKKSVGAQGSTWTKQAQLMPSNLSDYAEFGYKVALSADGLIALVVGKVSNVGAYVYLWKNGRWAEHQQINRTEHEFIGAISADGNYILLGPKGDVFVRNGDLWQYQQTLITGFSAYGYSMAVSADGSTAIIGDIHGSPSGSAYIFVRNGTVWTLQKQITTYPNQTVDDRFGFAVALSGDGNTALVTAMGRERATPGRGWGYFFTRTSTTWSDAQEVTGNSLNLDNSWFGESVAISQDGSTAIIGSPKGCYISCAMSTPGGIAYVYKHIGGMWELQGELAASPYLNIFNGYRFGASVSLSSDGNIAAISAFESEYTANQDSFIFARTGETWAYEQNLASPNPRAADGFGKSISISGNGNRVIIGAYTTGAFSNPTGAAYIYSRQPATSPTIFPDHPGVYYNGIFNLRESNTSGSADLTVAFGGDTSDLPIAGDWNGDGISTIGVYRSSVGQFFLSNSNTTPAVDYLFTFGNPDDAPLAGRWDDQITRDGVGVYRNSNGILYLKDYLSTGFSDYFAIYGNPGDIGVAGDWDGDGFDSVGIYRPAAQMWYLTNNHTPSGITFSDLAFVNSIGTAQPITGDWDADQISTTGYYFATVSGVFSRCIQNVAPAGCNTFGFGPAGGRGVTGYWGLTISPAPQYQILQPAKPTRHFSGNNIDPGRAD